MQITINGGSLPQSEIDFYVEQIKSSNPDKYIKSIDLTVDGEYVDVKYDYDVVPFERIRRITGYLVGTVDRFNNAKRAEVEDRVKHSVGDSTVCSIKDIA